MLLLACVPPVLEASPDSAAPVHTDSPEDSTVDSQDSSDTQDTEQAPLCSDDMVSMGSLCIDRYELHVGGAPGDADQFIGTTQPSDLITLSQVGLLPSDAVTFSQAWRACEARGGRLPSSEEWEDAADGQLGEGGASYPYGEDFDEGACVTVSAEDLQQFDAVQPSGSRSGCVSAFGAEDLVGNVWEWTVTPGLMEVEAWLAAGPVHVDEQGWLAGDPTSVAPKAVGVDPPVFSADDQGRLMVTAEQLDQRPAFGRRGYLVAAGPSPQTGEAFLPIELVQQEEDGPALVRVLHAADGLPVPDKRGCAWYTGQPWTCTNQKRSVGDHFHDFQGTIGFRCVEDQ